MKEKVMYFEYILFNQHDSVKWNMDKSSLIETENTKMIL